MTGKNFSTVTGFVGQDVELKVTSSGKKVVHGSLGVPFGFGDKKRTIWVRYEAWEKQAEFLGRWGKKGTALTIVGRLDVKEWTAPEDEKKHTEMVLIAEGVEFALTGKRDDTSASPASVPEPKQTTFEDIAEDDDLPF